ncbi:MAG: UvrD-helicase domain-containing protein [Acidaminococcaceae bacterium]|nr:UvrD-helicase domain-containing protein [Acidaminococcaceae bacterium]
MAENTKVAISADFLNAFAALPRQIQGKVTEFMNKFRNDPTSPGINYEKLNACQDKKMCSVRIDDTYRGIVVRQPETGVYLLLWVDHHDEAYAWAKNKKCEVNQKTGAIQIYDMIVTPQVIPAAQDFMLFSEVSDNDLIELGLPEDMLPFARGIGDAAEFYVKQSSFPADAFESLSWLVEGFPVDEVKAFIKQEQEAGKVSGNLADALESPETLKSFVVVEGEEELRRIMAEPLEKWRVFLHPTQRKIVNKNYSGAARVLGGAGTGKTVVAMHRAKHLAAGLKDKERILFTTYTANLASDIKDNLRKICTLEELRKIDVINLDAWVAQFLREHGYPAEIVYDDKVTKIWEDAVAANDYSGEFPVSFYEEEYNRVVVAQEAFSLEKYIKASRTGRGTRLDRKKRMQIWNVFEAYQNMMKEQKVRDINTAMYECRMLLTKSTSETRYKHVIVDEGQDLSVNGFRLLRAIAGEEHDNDIFIVGDAHQRIYKNKAALSKCGINVRGRSSILRINYRTTEEIRKAAFALLNGISFDDLDDDYDTGDRCQSLTHGKAPQVLRFDNANEEFNAVLKEIKALIGGGVSAKNICVVARTHKLLDDYIAQFTAKGLRCYEIKGNKADDRGLDGIRVATMHRVKGLEFQYIFVVAANKRIIPLASAIDHTDAVSEQETMTAEKCLLYVALTRAQKGAYISGYGQMSEFL